MKNAGPHGTLEMAVNVEKRAGIFSDEAQAGYELSRINQTDMERRETRRDGGERPASFICANAAKIKLSRPARRAPNQKQRTFSMVFSVFPCSQSE
jgi:hypothetical protein